MTIICVLSILVILASITAVAARDLLSTVISVGAAGFVLSVLFLMLGAPDLAITQVVVEVVCLVLLIREAVKHEDTTFDVKRNRVVVTGGLVGGAMFVAMAYYALQSMVGVGAPKMTLGQQYLQHGMEKTGAANFVTGVLLDFRAYDTLGEATVIFCSIIGVYAVIRAIGRRTDEGHDPDS